MLPDFVKEHNIGAVVADFLPLRKPMKWLDDVARKLPKNVAFCQVNMLLLPFREFSCLFIFQVFLFEI